MATTGLLDMDVVGIDSLSGTVAGGLEVLQKMMDTEAHDKTLAKCMIGAQFLEDHGVPFVAEYLRAFLAAMESTRDRSAAAFYRAKWHMMRIDEMRIHVADAALVDNVFADVNETYHNAESKYGSAVNSMMRAGQMPDLEKSFMPGAVPAPESCALFMAAYRQAVTAAQKSAAQCSGNKAGGFFKRIFKV